MSITALHDLQASNTEVSGLRVHNLVALQSTVEELWREYTSRKGTDHAAKTGSFVDAFTALTSAYFSAARILLGVSSSGRYVSELTGHAQVILDAASFLDTSRNAIAYMRMATPLLLVALHSRCRSHRLSAVDLFEGWTKRSMPGISALALDAISRRNLAN
jgi:hypothetical protein